MITYGRTVVLLMDAKLCINLRNVGFFLNPRVIFKEKISNKDSQEPQEKCIMGQFR